MSDPCAGRTGGGIYRLRIHILEMKGMDREKLIERIIELEWEMFQATQNAGGRADCQDDRPTFEIMRSSQAKIWSDDTLESYLRDLELAESGGENLIAYKYGYMMETTYPDEYEKIKNRLPAVSASKKALVDEICSYHGNWTREAHSRYPRLAARGRPADDKTAGGTWASVSNYLRSELQTYSERTLALCLRDTGAAAERGENLAVSIPKNTAAAYGFKSLDEVEAVLKNR